MQSKDNIYNFWCEEWPKSSGQRFMTDLNANLTSNDLVTFWGYKLGHTDHKGHRDLWGHKVSHGDLQ